MTPFVRDRRANFRQSLRVLEHAKEEGVKVTKTSVMLGVGEDEDGVMRALKGLCHFSTGTGIGCPLTVQPFILFRLTALRASNVDVVTFGQYMRPTKRHMKVDRYVEPAEFERWKQVAEDIGFLYVASGPLVRSSYKVRFTEMIIPRTFTQNYAL